MFEELRNTRMKVKLVVLGRENVKFKKKQNFINKMKNTFLDIHLSRQV